MKQLGIMMHLTPDADQPASELYPNAVAMLARLEQHGLQEAWVTEHHFNPHSLCPSPLLLMQSMLAGTQRLRLGSAAILLGFHQPISIAEQITTLSALYPQRVMMGFAKGGPFKSQNEAFAVAGDVSRARMLEALPAMGRLMTSEAHSHQGEHYQWSQINLQPKLTDDVPFFVASGDAQSIALAAAHNYGLMMAQFWPIEKVVQIRQQFLQHAPDSLPDVMAARGVFIADSRAEAEETALAFIHDFRSQRAQIWGKHQGPMTGVEDTELLSRMLVGRVDDVIEQVKMVLRAGVTRLAINPLTMSMSAKELQAMRFIQQVWPQC